MASFNEHLTNKGREMLAKMLNGGLLTFTKMVVGDGIIPAEDMEEDMTMLVNPVLELGIESVNKTADKKVIIRSTFNNTKVEAPFYFREKGVYGRIDGSEEYLMFYANNRYAAEYIETAESQLIEKVLRTIVAFSDSDNINITMNGGIYGPAPIVANDSENIEEFIEKHVIDESSGTESKNINPGTVIIIETSKGDEVYIFKGGDVTNVNNYIQVTGTNALVIMHQFIKPANRVKGSMYFQLGTLRRLAVKIYRQFFRQASHGSEDETLYFIAKTSKTGNESDGANYRFTCMNVELLEHGDTTTERKSPNFYINKD